MYDETVYPCTDDDFRLFRSFVDKWLRLLNLRRYPVTVTRESFRDDTQATIRFTTSSNVAVVIAINEKLESEPTPQHLERLALHEVLHLMFSEMYIAAQDKEASYAERMFRFERSEHMVITMLARRLLAERPLEPLDE